MFLCIRLLSNRPAPPVTMLFNVSAHSSLSPSLLPQSIRPPLWVILQPGCPVYRSRFIIFTPVFTCPLLLPDLLQHPPITSVENVLSHLTWVFDPRVSLCPPVIHLSFYYTFSCHHVPICHSHSSISLSSLWCVLPPPLPACLISLSCLPPVHPSLSLWFSLTFSLFLTHSHHSFFPWPHCLSQFQYSVINPAGPSISEVWEILLTTFSNLIFWLHKLIKLKGEGFFSSLFWC